MSDNEPEITSTTTAVEQYKPREYKKLLGAIDYDHEAAEELADALNEIKELEARANQLKQIVKENKDLHQFVWRSTSGVFAVHNIEDDHLTSIMMYRLRHNQTIPRAIRAESAKRGLVIPATVTVDWDAPMPRSSGLRAGAISDDMNLDLDDLDE